MAKQYDDNDFGQVPFFGNRKTTSVQFSNDDVQRIYGKKEPLQKLVSYKNVYLMPTFANDDHARQREETSSILSNFKSLESLRSQLSEEQYQLTRDYLQRRMLALCRDPSCSASPTAKQLREKIDKAYGGDRDR